MKIGKQPKRHGGPSQKFLERKAAQQAIAQGTPPKTGSVRIYLDDERPCPAGWTLTKSPAAFYALLGEDATQEDLERITHLSLDWYLGAGITNGEAVAEWLAQRFRANPRYLPNLEAIGCHSSDREKAIRMIHTLLDSLDEERRYEIMIDTGTPRR